jgi:hypothetical protein
MSHSSIDNQAPERERAVVRDHPNSSLGTILDKRVTPRITPTMSVLSSNMADVRDPFAPHSYDPVGGFLIFFDFIFNLPVHIEQARMITCLHHPRSGIGEPSTLDRFRCETFVDPKSGERIRITLIAMKQPVPRSA